MVKQQGEIGYLWSFGGGEVHAFNYVEVRTRYAGKKNYMTIETGMRRAAVLCFPEPSELSVGVFTTLETTWELYRGRR